MVDYRSAGTVEYLYDTDSGKWYFLGEYTDSIGKFVTKIRHKNNSLQKYFVAKVNWSQKLIRYKQNTVSIRGHLYIT